MFNKKEYFEVNREERHFENLLMSSIIYDEIFRQHFFTLINEKLEKDSYLCGSFDIYSEVAILRDYWHDLSANNKQSCELSNEYRRIICLCFENFGLCESLLDKYPLFKTNNQLCFPGKWTITKRYKEDLLLIETLKDIQNDNFIKDNKLCRIKWAFNAKPDLLIISNHNCVIIELKLESRIGTNSNGYNQIETQTDVACLMKKTIPIFGDMNIEHILITKKGGKSNISWQEVLSIKDKISNELVKIHFNELERNFYA